MRAVLHFDEDFIKNLVKDQVDIQVYKEMEKLRSKVRSIDIKEVVRSELKKMLQEQNLITFAKKISRRMESI